MVNENSVSPEWIQLMLKGFSDLGLDTNRLCEASELDCSKFKKLYYRFPHEQVFNLWLHAQMQFQVSAIGLEMAISGLYKQLKPLAFTFLSSESIAEAINKIVPFVAVMSTGVELELSLSNSDEFGNTYVLTFKPTNSKNRLAPASVEFTLISIVKAISDVSHNTVKPVELEFEHRQQTDIEKYDEVCGRSIFFADRNAITFRKADLDKPIYTADKSVADYCERVKAADLTHSQIVCISDQVRNDIIQSLDKTSLSIETLAKSYCMATRTLQRKLKQEGWTFRELFEDARRANAEEYVRTTHKNMAEVAALLGFSDRTAFMRAFKRWFLKTPNQYRNDYQKLERSLLH